MDDKFIQALHSELSSSYELGTVEEFGKKLASDDVFRKALFDDASKTLDLGDYATFEGQVKKKVSTEFPLPSIENLQKDFQKRQQESGDFSVVPQPDKPEEKRQTSVAGDLLRTLKSTSLRALGGIAAVPNLGDKTIDRLVLYPIAKAMSPGATDEAIETGLSVMQMASPGGGQLETLAQYGATAQDKLSKVAVRTDAKMKQIEGGIIKNFKEGNVGEAFEQLARGVVGTIPYLAEVAATAGGGAAAVLSTIGATAASQQYGEIKGREDLSGGGKILNSWLYGGFEAAGELVTAGILNRTFRALRGAGVQPTKEVTENLAKSLLRKFGIIGKEGGSEAVSEMVTQVGQNLTAMWTGEDTERKWHDGALDAGLIGFFPGAGMGTIQAAVAGRAIATKEEVDAVNESHAKQAAIIEQIEAAENIETKEVLEQELIAEKDNEQSVIEANIEVARTMTEEQLAEVSKLQTARAELDAKISDPALPKEERANIESISKGIDEQIIEIREATPKVDNGASDIAPRIEGKTESDIQVPPEADMPSQTEEEGTTEVKSVDKKAVEKQETTPAVSLEPTEVKKEVGVAPTTEQLQEVTSIYVAPYRVSQVDKLSDEKAFDDGGYVQLREETEKIAKAMGFGDIKTTPFIGGYTEHNAETNTTTRSQEPSVRIDIPTAKIEDVNLMSALVGTLAPETQNSVMRVSYGTETKGTMLEVKLRDADVAEKIAGELQNLGFSFDNRGKILYLAAQDVNEYDKLLKIINNSGDGIESIRKHRAEIDFFDEGRYREALSEFKNSGRYGRDDWKDISLYVDKALEKLERPRREVTRAETAQVEAPQEPVQNEAKVEQVPPPVEPTEPTVEQPEGGKRSGFEERSVENRTDEVGKAVKKIIDDNPHFYKELHQEDAIKQAQDLISSFGSIDNAYEDLLKKTTVLEDLPIRHVARQILMQHYAGELRTALGQNNQSAADALSNKIVKIDEILVKEVTLSGQTSAMTMWRLLNPEASVFMVQKLFNEINRTKLGFEAKQAEDFIDKWDKEVPDVVKRLLTENQELRKQIEEIRSKTGAIPVKRLPKEKAKDWAAAVRALKSSNRGMAFADPIGAVAIIDGALEVTARTIETTGNVIQAIQEGIAVIRASKWYKSLTKAQQKDAEKKFSDDIRSGMPDFDAAEYMEGRSWFKPVPTEEEVAAKAEKKATAKAKRDADKKLQEQIYDIIASHWLVGKDTQQTLVDRLMEELGLTRGEATKIAGVAEAAVEADAKRVFDTTLGKKIPNKQMRKSAFDKFFALIKRGVLSNDNYYEVFAEKHKLKKGLTPEEKEELQRLSVQADIMKPYGYFGEMAYAEFMQYMGKVTEADSWVTRQSKLIISANYARMLSGITTHKVNITSSGANLLITPLLGINPVHLHNWAKVIDAIARGDKAKLKLSNPLIPIWYAFASYPAGSGVGFTEAKNIIRHGNIKMASKYMESVNNLGGTAIPELEKNKFGAGKRFRPLNIPLPKGKKFDANPWNAMKYSGRTLLAEDAFMFNTAFAQELALAARRAEITEGTKLSEKELRTKLINEIAGRFLTKEQSDAIENQIEEQVTMLRNGGIEPTPNQIRQRRFELTRSLLDLSQERIEEATQMARGEIFTDMRGGVFSQFGDFLGRIFGKNVLIKLGTMPKIPFTGVLGRVADMAIDTAPGYGLLRAYGWSPTGIIARGQQWHRTGSARDFFVAPAKYGLFRSAQLGEKGSARFERQLARAYFGVFSVAIAAAVFLGSDDDNLDEDGHPKIDITGGLAFADVYEKEQHYLGPYTIKIGKFKLRYLNYPIMNMPLAIIGNYKDHLRAGKDPDDALATLMLTAEAYWHSLFMVKDTWLAKGINDLVELVGGAINSIGGSESKEKLKDEEQMKILDPRVTRQMETMKDDYTGLVFKYVSPLRSNMVQQIVRFSAPEGRLKGKNTDLLMYNLGLQWITNDKRTDIFGQTIKTLPGDQGIAWPREDDDRWAKMWEYNIHLTDIRASDKLIIDGLPQTLEWDQYIERKKRTSELFKERFDKYFAETPKEVLEKKATTFTTDPRTRVMNNYVHEDISSIWSRTKEDVERSMFVWGNQSKAEPKLFDFLTKNSAIPDFYNKKFKVDPNGYLMVATSDDAPEDLLILPYPVLRKINDTAMDGFIKAAKDWMGEEFVEKKDFYKKRMQSEWGYQLDYVILDKNAELLEAVREMANDRE